MFWKVTGYLRSAYHELEEVKHGRLPDNPQVRGEELSAAVDGLHRTFLRGFGMPEEVGPHEGELGEG